MIGSGREIAEHAEGVDFEDDQSASVYGWTLATRCPRGGGCAGAHRCCRCWRPDPPQPGPSDRAARSPTARALGTTYRLGDPAHCAVRPGWTANPAAAAVLPWRRLLLAGWLLNLAWMCSLTLVDGLQRGWVDVLLDPNEYLHDLPRIS